MAKPYRVLICGDRNWGDRSGDRIILAHTIEKLYKEYKRDLMIIHGGARGADTMAGEIAGALGIPVCVFPAQWRTFGRGAGPIRNRWMLRFGRPHLVISCHQALSASKGTKDMVQLAQSKGVKWEHISGLAKG